MQIKTPTPLYAAVGAGDALVSKVRGADAPKVRFDVDAIVRDLRNVQGQAKSIRLSELPRQFKQVSLADVQSQVRSLQGQLKSVQGQAQHAASDTVGQLGNAYGDFAKRGEQVVTNVRSRDLVDDFTTTARSGAADVIGDVKGRVAKLQGDVEPVTEPVDAPADRADEASEPVEKAPSKAARATAGTSSAKSAGTTKKSTAKKTGTAGTTKKPSANKKAGSTKKSQ